MLSVQVVGTFTVEQHGRDDWRAYLTTRPEIRARAESFAMVLYHVYWAAWWVGAPCSFSHQSQW